MPNDTPKLKPCPCCGGKALFHYIRNGENAGGNYIECSNKACAITTNLRFSLMEDARPLLAETWNRRTHE